MVSRPPEPGNRWQYFCKWERADQTAMANVHQTEQVRFCLQLQDQGLIERARPWPDNLAVLLVLLEHTYRPSHL